MPKISAKADYQTVITTYDVNPGTCQEVLDLLSDAYASFLSRQPGFIAVGLHVNDAQCRIASYSQWEKREDFQAVLRAQEMQKRNRRIADLSKSFEPVMYDVAGVFT